MTFAALVAGPGCNCIETDFGSPSDSVVVFEPAYDTLVEVESKLCRNFKKSSGTSGAYSRIYSTSPLRLVPWDIQRSDGPQIHLEDFYDNNNLP